MLYLCFNFFDGIDCLLFIYFFSELLPFFDTAADKSGKDGKWVGLSRMSLFLMDYLSSSIKIYFKLKYFYKQKYKDCGHLPPGISWGP
jgi:hypothetical protein